MSLPESDQILSVSAFNRRIKDLLEGTFPDVWIQGEISNLRRQSSGHCYFSLKDADAQVSAVLFRGHAAKLAIDLRDGMAVVAYGNVSVYEARGQYQLIVRHLQEAGLGRLQAAFEELKRRLAAEGLFDAERKRPLPRLPRVIGFVTSPTGAALRDFVSILQRRRWTGRLIVFPARVQGSEAAGEIAAMIGLVPHLPDLELLVVGRGGGSLEDLWPFNEEVVVRALAACPVPTVSAVGHEIDFTLSDFAADHRAETPSAAAELITSLFVEATEEARSLADRLDRAWKDGWRHRQHSLQVTGAHLARLSPQARLEQQFLRLDDAASRLDTATRALFLAAERRVGLAAEGLRSHHPGAHARLARAKLDALAGRLHRTAGQVLPRRRERLTALGKRLAAADPRQPLKRGYTLVHDAAGRLIPRRAKVPAGPLTIEFSDGKLQVHQGDPPARGKRRREAHQQGDLFGDTADPQ